MIFKEAKDSSPNTKGKYPFLLEAVEGGGKGHQYCRRFSEFFFVSFSTRYDVNEHLVLQNFMYKNSPHCF